MVFNVKNFCSLLNIRADCVSISQLTTLIDINWTTCKKKFQEITSNVDISKKDVLSDITTFSFFSKQDVTKMTKSIIQNCYTVISPNMLLWFSGGLYKNIIVDFARRLLGIRMRDLNMQRFNNFANFLDTFKFGTHIVNQNGQIISSNLNLLNVVLLKHDNNKYQVVMVRGSNRNIINFLWRNSQLNELGLFSFFFLYICN